MKKFSFSRFFKREGLPFASIPIASRNLFLAGLRCSSDQLQVVVLQLPFAHKGARLLF